MRPLSRRSRYDAHLNPLTRALSAHQGPLIDLTRGNPTTARLPYSDALIRAALSDPAGLTYRAAPFGAPRARAAIAELLGVEPWRVMLTASTSEAYAYLFKALCDPGDVIAIPRPSYPLFEQLAAFEGVATTSYPLIYDGRWSPIFPSAEAARGLAALLIVNPNNPTGQQLKRGDLDTLAALEIPIICDEVFRPFPLDVEPDGVASLIGWGGPAIVLGGLSKWAGLPQMKLSWAIIGGPESFARPLLERLELIADTYLSVAGPIQQALPLLLDSRHRLTDALSARLRANLDHIKAACVGRPIEALKVEGGWYATLKLPATQDEEAWALTLLQARGVLIQPGYFYDFNDRGAYIVLSLLTPPGLLQEGLKRMIEGVEGALSAG